jgi:hypothetical protein
LSKCDGLPEEAGSKAGYNPSGWSPAEQRAHRSPLRPKPTKGPIAQQRARAGYVLPVVIGALATGVAAADCVVAVDTQNVTHQANVNHPGCHSDAGYAHEARIFCAELIYGASFQAVPDGLLPHEQIAVVFWLG